MFNFYSSSKPGDDSGYLQSNVSGDSIDAGVSASRDVVYNGEWITQVPTANDPFNHGSLDASNGTRTIPHLQVSGRFQALTFVIHLVVAFKFMLTN